MFSRIKVGIWRDDRYSVSDWVLSRFRDEELESLHGEVQDWVDSRIREWIWG
jgi:peptidyl-tRNA hydrolase